MMERLKDEWTMPPQNLPVCQNLKSRLYYHLMARAHPREERFGTVPVAARNALFPVWLTRIFCSVPSTSRSTNTQGVVRGDEDQMWGWPSDDVAAHFEITNVKRDCGAVPHSGGGGGFVCHLYVDFSAVWAVVMHVLSARRLVMLTVRVLYCFGMNFNGLPLSYMENCTFPSGTGSNRPEQPPRCQVAL